MKKEPVFPIDREHVRPEVDLAPLIAQINAGTYVPLGSLDELRAVRDAVIEPGISDQEKLRRFEIMVDKFHAFKPEQNALLAVIIARIWNNPDFVTLRRELSDEPLNVAMRIDRAVEMFAEFTTDWYVDELKFKPVAKRDPLAVRLEEYMDLRTSGHGTPARILRQGLGTVEQVTKLLVRTMYRFERKHGATLTNPERAEIAKRAFRNIGVVLASINQEAFVPMFDEILAREESLFDMVKEGDTYVIRIKPEVFSQIPIVTEMRGKRTRCPALYPVDGKPSVIAEYFEWIVELIRTAPEKA